MCLCLSAPMNQSTTSASSRIVTETTLPKITAQKQPPPSKGAEFYPSRLIGAVLMECNDLLLVGKKTLNINILVGCGGR
jgi:hypothetical protein